MAAAMQRRQAGEYIQDYDDFTIESLLKLRAKNCEYHMLPAKLKRPVQTNQDDEYFFAGLKDNLSGFEARSSCL